MSHRHFNALYLSNPDDHPPPGLRFPTSDARHSSVESDTTTLRGTPTYWPEETDTYPSLRELSIEADKHVGGVPYVFNSTYDGVEPQSEAVHRVHRDVGRAGPPAALQGLELDVAVSQLTLSAPSVYPDVTSALGDRHDLRSGFDLEDGMPTRLLMDELRDAIPDQMDFTHDDDTSLQERRAGCAEWEEIARSKGVIKRHTQGTPEHGRRKDTLKAHKPRVPQAEIVMCPETDHQSSGDAKKPGDVGAGQSNALHRDLSESQAPGDGKDAGDGRVGPANPTRRVDADTVDAEIEGLQDGVEKMVVENITFCGNYATSDLLVDEVTRMRLGLPPPAVKVTAPKQPQPFGFSPRDIQPLAPPAGEFKCTRKTSPEWVEWRRNLPATLTPPPAAIPPDHRAYPQSLVWRLYEGDEYETGCHYGADLSTARKDLDRETRDMNYISTPPGVKPVWSEEMKKLLSQPIPGMVEMPTGVPFAYHIDGDRRKLVTVGCVQTVESLQRYPEGPRVSFLSQELYTLVFGRLPSKDLPPVQPLFTYQGLERNDRSTAPPPGNVNYDGTYNLAATIEKGHADGKIVPAVQIGYSAAHRQISRVLKILNELYRLIMPKCISKFEMDMIDFHARDNNIFTFGGEKTAGTGVQLNISSCFNGEDLVGSMDFQGSWHKDPDALTTLTLFVLMLRLPKGADPGPFLLGRLGTYCRETGVLTIFLVFRGNDMHTGTPPSIYEAMARDEALARDLQALSEIWENCGIVNRVGLVLYHSSQATFRDSAIAVTPETRFGNHGTLSASMSRSLNFAQDGQHILGPLSVAAARLSWDQLFGAVNGLVAGGLIVDPKIIEGTCSYIKYLDTETGLEGTVKAPEDNPLDPKQLTRILTKRRYFKWYHDLCLSIFLNVRRADYKQNLLEYRKDLEKKIQAAPDFSFKDLHPVTLRPTTTVQESDVVQVCMDDDQPLSHHEEEDGGAIPSTDMSVDSHLGIFEDSVSLEVETEHSSLGASSPHRDVGGGPPDVDEAAAKERGSRRLTALASSSVPQLDPPAVISTSGPAKDKTGSSSKSGGGMSAKVTSGKKTAGLGGGGSKAPAAKDTRTNTTGSKRKRAASPESVPGSSEDEEEYDIERVVNHMIVDGMYKFEVKYAEYGSEKNRWHWEADLSNLATMVKRYKRQKCLPEDVVEATLSEEEDTTLDEPTLGNVERLEALLSPSNLEEALQGLSGRMDGLLNSERGSSRNPASALKDTLQRIDTLNKEQNDLTNRLHATPFDDSGLSESSHVPQSEGADIYVTRLLTAVRIIPTLAKQSLSLDIMSHYMCWQECRSLLILQDFMCGGLDALIKILFHAYYFVDSQCTKDGEYLRAHYPRYYGLVNHTIQYVHKRKLIGKPPKKPKAVPKSPPKSQPKRKRQKRKTASETTSETSQQNQPESPHGEPFLADPDTAPATNEWEHLPADLYGLLPEPQRQSKKIKMPNVVKVIKNRAEELVRAKQCFKDIFVQQCIHPHMREPTESTMKLNKASILNRCLLRGLVVQCIVEAVGHEFICAAPAMRAVLNDPQSLFGKVYPSGIDALWKRLEKDEGKTMLSPLRAWLDKGIDDGTRNASRYLGQFIHRHYLEIQLGRDITEDEFFRDIAPEDSERSSRVHRRGLGKPIHLTPDNFLKGGETPHYGIAGFILREAINKSEGLPVANEGCRWYLDGKRVTDGREMAGADPDHANPLRHKTVGATLMKKKVPGKALTRPTGLSNLLTFTGTGQGYKTAAFLALSDSSGPSGQDGFCSEDLAGAEKVFEDGIQHNIGVIGNYKSGWANYTGPYIDPAEEKDVSKVKGLVQISNAKVFGTASNSLKLLPTIVKRGMVSRRATLKDKLGPYWEESVIEAWKNYLPEGMEGTDPETYDGKKKSWRETLEFVMNLNISGFKSGLTVLQLVNNLVLSGVCLPPTLDEIAEWVWENPALGAFRGLEAVGFILHNQQTVGAALKVVDADMQKYLSKENKKIVGYDIYGAIILEHALCKVVRWKKRVTGLVSLADVAEKYTVWNKPGEPTHLQFPFPLRGALDCIEKILLEEQGTRMAATVESDEMATDSD